MKSTAAADPTDFVALAKGLVPKIDASAEEIDRIREIPKPLLESLHDAGMFRLLVPNHLGGPEVDPLTFALAIEELASADASTTWCLAQLAVCSMFAAYMNPSAAEAIFKNDPRAAIASGPETPDSKAVAVKGGYRVTATWNFCSGGRHANWMGGNCPVYEEDGTPRMTPDGFPVRRTMVFPTAKAVRTDTWQVMGLRGTGSDRFAVTDLFVPQDYTFTEEERKYSSPLYNFTIVGMFGVGLASIAIGIARRMLASFVELAGSKTPRGGKSVMRDNAVIQLEVAVAEAQIRSARAYVAATVRELWDEVKDGENMLSLEQRIHLRLTTVHAIRICKETADAIYQAAGATAIFNSQPYERRFRDMHALTQQVNGHRANYETIGKFLLGVELPNTTYLLRRS